MRLTDLYARVTEAIARAEALEAQEQHRDATIAYHEVSRIEEQIARHLPASVGGGEDPRKSGEEIR